MQMNEPVELKLKVLKVTQKIGDFYIASMNAQDLVSISYADVRRLVTDERDLERYLGIQRPVSKKRIIQIKKYLESNDATFPTSVIIAIDEKCAEFSGNVNDQVGELILKPFASDQDDQESIPFNRIAKVIDGQHRIAAFMDENDNWNFEFNGDARFEINVSIFIGADVSEQANIFATVNLAQTKVNRSLVYDLTELAKSPSPFKTCHNVAVALDAESSSPLYKRIKRLGTATPGRVNEPLTQAAFVETLMPFISKDPVDDRNRLLDGKRLTEASLSELSDTPFRNLFINNNEIDIAEILFNYFSAIREKWPNSWDAINKTGNLLPRSNAFKAFMKYLKNDVYYKVVDGNYGEIPKSSDFKKFFDHIELTDDDFTVKNFAPGSGGQSTFLKLLRGEVSLDDIVE
jgi:DGQHR domain-containing protein